MNSTATSLAPPSLSQAEFDQGKLYIEQTRDGLLGATRLLTLSQWGFQPALERWSIAQIVEHVIAVQERVMEKLHQGLADAPAPPPEQDRQTVDSIVMNQFPNRLAKFPSPIPSGPPLDQTAAAHRYRENCAAFTAMLTATPGLREHALDSPPLKAVSRGAYSVMDGYQWILVAAAHAERHTKQILEVIADPAFPLR